jgi:hypothetical protein
MFWPYDTAKTFRNLGRKATKSLPSMKYVVQRLLGLIFPPVTLAQSPSQTKITAVYLFECSKRRVLLLSVDVFRSCEFIIAEAIKLTSSDPVSLQ